MVIIDGKKISNDIKIEIKNEVNYLKKHSRKIPKLVAVLIGNNGASITYVNSKKKACDYVGFESEIIKLPDTITDNELLILVDKLNNDISVDGFIIQLPLPEHINTKKIIQAISPKKDVDGFHPENVGKSALNLPSFLPATPYGILQLIERYNIETSGKHCVIVGRSNIVGAPMSILMGRNTYPGNCTVTLTHSRTTNIKEYTLKADILIVALGKKETITADMVKDNVVIIDVGITRVEDKTKKTGYRLVGDVKFDEVSTKASFITPVPGGVGPMTIVSLLKNTLIASKNK